MPQPLPRPTPDPFRPTDTPPPLRGQAKAPEVAQGASRSPNHTAPGPQDRPHRLAILLQCPPWCALQCPLPWPARPLLLPLPAFRAREPRSRARPFRPSPSLRNPTARRLRPFASAAPPCITSSPPAGAYRALVLPPARDALFRLPASSRFPLLRSSSARLFLRVVLCALRPCRTDRSPRKGIPTTNK